MEILKIHASKITKHGEVDYESVVKLAENFNGADLRNICTEAGMFAIRCAPSAHVLPSGARRYEQRQRVFHQVRTICFDPVPSDRVTHVYRMTPSMSRATRAVRVTPCCARLHSPTVGTSATTWCRTTSLRQCASWQRPRNWRATPPTAASGAREAASSRATLPAALNGLEHRGPSAGRRKRAAGAAPPAAAARRLRGWFACVCKNAKSNNRLLLFYTLS